MLREAVMTQNNVKTPNLSSASSIHAILNRHEFSVLSKIDDGIQLATRNYDFRGVACCDILVYKEILCKKNHLRGAVKSLIQVISSLQDPLQNNPHQLIPQVQSRSISFLRKKATILTNERYYPISCQIIPLLLFQRTGKRRVVAENFLL